MVTFVLCPWCRANHHTSFSFHLSITEHRRSIDTTWVILLHPAAMWMLMLIAIKRHQQHMGSCYLALFRMLYFTFRTICRLFKFTHNITFEMGKWSKQIGTLSNSRAVETRRFPRCLDAVAWVLNKNKNERGGGGKISRDEEKVSEWASVSILRRNRQILLLQWSTIDCLPLDELHQSINNISLLSEPPPCDKTLYYQMN